MCDACVSASALPLLALLFFAIWLAFHLLSAACRCTRLDTLRCSRAGLSLCGKLPSVAVLVLAVALGALSYDDNLRAQTFSRFMTMMSGKKDLDAVRCGMLGGIGGNVLELGPGPGTNFRCWDENPATTSNVNTTRTHTITSWTGVDPNTYFREALEAERVKRGLSFPVEVVGLRGEDIDAPSGTYDRVVSTHVFCSVHDQMAVLKQAARVLKPGGTLHFLEHVAAEEADTVRGMLQQLVAPLFAIVGNGCQFRDVGKDLATAVELGVFEDLRLERFEAPMPWVVAPHVKGTARRPPV